MSDSPFHVNRIPNSNLLLIVINKMNEVTSESSEHPTEPLTVEPKEMETGNQYGVVRSLRFA